MEYRTRSGVPRSGKAECCSLCGVPASRTAALTWSGVAVGNSAVEQASRQQDQRKHDEKHLVLSMTSSEIAFADQPMNAQARTSSLRNHVTKQPLGANKEAHG